MDSFYDITVNVALCAARFNVMIQWIVLIYQIDSQSVCNSLFRLPDEEWAFAVM